MIPNGKEMDWDGHHLVFESTTYQCRGCFFEDRGSCPDCDEGLWVEENPSPWHTGKPTEEGWYLLALTTKVFNDKPFCVAYMDGNHWLGINDFYILVDDVSAWQKIEPYKESIQ